MVFSSYAHLYHYCDYATSQEMHAPQGLLSSVLSSARTRFTGCLFLVSLSGFNLAATVQAYVNSMLKCFNRSESRSGFIVTCQKSTNGSQQIP